MKTRRRTDLCLVVCGILIWFLADTSHIRMAATKALSLCGGTVIPSLFPFMVMSTLLVSLGFGEWISPCFSGLMTSLFRLPGTAGSALILGLIGGYPIGARTAGDLYRSGLLTREEAERLLMFCNNSNPAFLISVLGAGIFGSLRIGVWLWLIHILSALLTGILFRSKPSAPTRYSRAATSQPRSFAVIFVESVRNSAAVMLSVCAFVVLFYVMASPFTALGGKLGSVLVGVTELFSLTPLLTPDAFSFILASGCAGWGGLSVLCQSAAVLDGTALRLRSCLLGKMVQGLLAAFLAFLLARFVLK